MKMQWLVECLDLQQSLLLKCNFYRKSGISKDLHQKFRNSRKRTGKHHPEVVAKRINMGNQQTNAAEGRPPSSSVSKNQWNIPNFLPERPEGEDDTSIDRHLDIIQLQHRLPPSKKDHSLLNQALDATFATRREDIISKGLSITDLRQKYPCLFEYEEVRIYLYITF
jgi:hypothetical protein